MSYTNQPCKKSQLLYVTGDQTYAFDCFPCVRYPTLNPPSQHVNHMKKTSLSRSLTL